MILLGLLLLLIGFIANVALLWTLGTIALVVGVALMILGGVGHAVGGGRRYFWRRLTHRVWCPELDPV